VATQLFLAEGRQPPPPAKSVDQDSSGQTRIPLNRLDGALKQPSKPKHVCASTSGLGGAVGVGRGMRPRAGTHVSVRVPTLSRSTAPRLGTYAINSRGHCLDSQRGRQSQKHKGHDPFEFVTFSAAVRRTAHCVGNVSAVQSALCGIGSSGFLRNLQRFIRRT
jgi:hypothetical protein